jgi:hypothetical protein
MAGEENDVATGGAGDQGAAGASENLDAVIGAFVATAKQLPGVIPELITGKTVTEVNASIDAAKAAFARVAGQVAPAAAAGGNAAGGVAAAVVGSGASGGAGGSGDGEYKPTASGAFNKILAGIEKGNRGQSR